MIISEDEIVEKIRTLLYNKKIQGNIYTEPEEIENLFPLQSDPIHDSVYDVLDTLILEGEVREVISEYKEPNRTYYLIGGPYFELAMEWLGARHQEMHPEMYNSVGEYIGDPEGVVVPTTTPSGFIPASNQIVVNTQPKTSMSLTTFVPQMFSDYVTVGETRGQQSVNFTYIQTPSALRDVIVDLATHTILGFDTETVGLDPFEPDALSLIQIGHKEHTYVIDARSVDVQPLKQLLEDPAIAIIIQNALFDYQMMKQQTGIVINNIIDTMLAQRILTAGLSRESSLDFLSTLYLGVKLDKTVRNTFIGYRGPFTEEQIAYSTKDVDVLFEIWRQQRLALGSANLVDIAKLEFQCVTAIADMQLAGMLIDQTKWRTILTDNEQKRLAMIAQIVEEFSGTITQKTLWGEVLTRTKGAKGKNPANEINLTSATEMLNRIHTLGQYELDHGNPIGAEMLDLISSEEQFLHPIKHPAVQDLLTLRGYEKVKTSFGENIMDLINPYTGRIHPSYQQLGADTGRFSCAKPNVQQIPHDSLFRACFIASPGNKIITADYAGAELRLLAELSQDPAFIEAFRSGQDLHSRTASQMYNVSMDYVKEHKNLRQAAKCFHPDTEILTRTGWRKIASINIDTEIVQASHHKKKRNCPVFEWVYPTEVFSTNHHSKEIVHLKSDTLDIRVTADHRLYTISNDDDVKVKLPGQITTADNFSMGGKFTRSEREKPFSDTESRFMHAAIITYFIGTYSQSVIKLETKNTLHAAYIKAALKRIPHTYQCLNQKYTYLIHGITAEEILKYIPNGCLSWDLFTTGTNIKNRIIKYLSYWSESNIHFTKVAEYKVKDQQTADIIQALYTTEGNRVAVESERNGSCFVVIHKNHKGRTSGFKRTVEPFTDEVVCLSVPSTFVLIRYNGCAVITGQTINFGLAYGQGPAKLANSLGIPVEEGKKLVQQYFKAYGGIKKWLENAANSAVNDLYSTTMYGRKRYYHPLPPKPPRTASQEIQSDWRKLRGNIERRGKNSPIQGCLHSNSLIFIENQGYLFIGDATKNKKISIWDGENFVKAIVVYKGPKYLVNITLCNNITIGCSPNHVFKTTHDWDVKDIRWIKAEDLVVGLHYILLGKDPYNPTEYVGFECIQSIEFTDEYVEMYDVVNSDSGQFMVNGVITHNSNADMTKLALISLNNALQPYDAHIINTVHDEIMVECREDIAEEVAHIVEDSMVKAGEVLIKSIPVLVDVHVADHWSKD